MSLRILTALAIGASMSATAIAAPKNMVGDTQSGVNGWSQSENASSNSCFGQARAWFSSTMGQGTNPYFSDGETNGTIISQRAQAGTNAYDNQEFIEAYCALLGDE